MIVLVDGFDKAAKLLMAAVLLEPCLCQFFCSGAVPVRESPKIKFYYNWILGVL